ncbi:MAG: virion core protein, T7 gp14 family, partial [Candidatus Binatia bacterium]
MAQALPVILMAASAVVTAVGYMQSASAESRAAKYNERVAQNNATIARTQGAIAEDQHRRKMVKILGHNRAAYGASGVTMEGSPLDVLSDVASQGELDAQIIRYNTEAKARGFQGTAGLESMRADDARTSGYLSA